MAAISDVGAAAAEQEAEDFSLVLGGPLFQLLRRARLSDDALGLLHRRMVMAVLVFWAPIVVLSALQGALVGPGQTFLNDIGMHLRLLVAAPLLIAAELVVHQRLKRMVGEFEVRGLVPPADLPRFRVAIAEAMRLRNSVFAEVLLLVFVYAAGLTFTLHRYEAMRGPAWYAPGPDGEELSPAGLWLVCVSLPLFQFLLLRWAFRLAIWTRFLWRTARLDLDLNVLHPDKAAGLGFLGGSLRAFAPIALATGVLFAGVIADRIFFTGARLMQFKLEIAGGAAALVVVFAGPLAVFALPLARTKRMGLLEYGALGETYVRGFRDKWMRGPPPDEPLVGSGDIQSLADLGNSYGLASQTRLVPIAPTLVIAFVAAFLAPMLPLLLTMMSVEKLIDQVVGLVF